MKIKLVNKTGVQKSAKVGFSFTTAFFGGWVQLFRGNIIECLKWLMFNIITLGIWGIVQCFTTNKKNIVRLIEQGYVPQSEADIQVLKNRGIIAQQSKVQAMFNEVVTPEKSTEDKIKDFKAGCDTFVDERSEYKAFYKELYGVSWGASKKLNILFLGLIGLDAVSFLVLPLLIVAIPMTLVVVPMFLVKLIKQANEMKKYGFTMMLGVKSK